MRCVNLEEKVTVEFYDQEHEEWGLKEATIEDVLDSVCSTQYTEIEAEKKMSTASIPTCRGCQVERYGSSMCYSCARNFADRYMEKDE